MKKLLLASVKFLILALILQSADAIAAEPTSYFLIGNSLTWDTAPSKLDGDIQWHVDCGKSLPYIVQHPEEPCVKSSTLWPTALKEKRYDLIPLQAHYGSMLAEDVAAISSLIELQPKARVIIHTGWARAAERVAKWKATEENFDSSQLEVGHNVGYFDALLRELRNRFPLRSFQRTQAIDILQQVEIDIAENKAPLADVTELYRDKIHMNLVTGRYLMHNAMRHALGQPRSTTGFEKLDPKTGFYLDSILDRVLK